MASHAKLQSDNSRRHSHGSARLIRHLIPISLLIVTGCSKSIANMSCADVANEAVRNSGGKLLKIEDRVLTSRTDTEIVCHGTGLHQNGNNIPTRFTAFIDGDHEIIVRSDTKEWQDQQSKIYDEEQKRVGDEIMSQYPNRTSSGHF